MLSMRAMLMWGLSAFVGATLFYAMHLMIRPDAIFEKPEKNRVFLDFVRVKQNEITQTKKRKPPPAPPSPEETPETPELTNQMANLNPNISMDMPTIGLPVNSGDGPFLGTLQQGAGMQGFDTDVIPLMRVAPIYPRTAKQAGIEGSVTMAVTIRPDGSVSNAKILESKPKRLFDKSALDAIKRWKFRPKVVNGSPVSQRARQVIEFKLDNAT